MSRRWSRSEEGAAAVEFALVLAPLLALVFMALQTTIVFFMDQALQTATKAAARQLMTGAAQTSGSTQAQFKSTLCQSASMFSCSGLMVDVESATTFSSLNTAPPTLTYSNGHVSNTWGYSPGGPGDVVIVRTLYLWPVFGGPFAAPLVNQPGAMRLLTATVVFKNEPYGS